MFQGNVRPTKGERSDMPVDERLISTKLKNMLIPMPNEYMMIPDKKFRIAVSVKITFMICVRLNPIALKIPISRCHSLTEAVIVVNTIDHPMRMIIIPRIKLN
jgi:hypothetical protein